MTDIDERDLSAPFEELTAPRSTAGYAQRAPSVAAAGGARRWPQLAASALAVVVAVAGAGTFLALRNARQSTLATRSAGAPPARTGAAMAYDSTAGRTVMYGGSAASGAALHDTWVWNGSAWSAAAAGEAPGPMTGAHLSDDPADGGVLLVGYPQPTTGGTVGCATGGSGSGSANAGTAVAGPPSTAGGAPAATTGTLPVEPAPTSVPLPAVSACPVIAAPTEQTWVYNAQGWHRVDAAAGAVVPVAGAQLAYDAATGQVLAVATLYHPCGIAAGSGTTAQPMIPCEEPLAASGGTPSSGSAPMVCTVNACPIGRPCPTTSVLGCGSGGGLSTWAWSNGRWVLEPSATGQPTGVTSALLVGGAGSSHASLVTEGSGAGCPAFPGCAVPSTPTTTLTLTWTWTGSAWADPRATAGTAAFALAGATATDDQGNVLAVTAAGEPWTLTASGWVSHQSTPSPSQRTGSAVAAGPGGTFVLFGGTAGGAVVSNAGATSASVGSDTWTWDAAAGWRHAGGAVPVAPTACPGAAAKLTFPGCVEILPATVPPATPQGAPAAAP